MPGNAEETFNAFTTYLHFVKEEDFELTYADLRMTLLDSQIDPIEFRDRILSYIEKIVREARPGVAENGILFNRYRTRLQRTADELHREFGEVAS